MPVVASPYFVEYRGKVGIYAPIYEEVDTTMVWIPSVLADIFKPNVKILGEMEISGEFSSLKAFVWEGKKYHVNDNREVSIEDFEDNSVI